MSGRRCRHPGGGRVPILCLSLSLLSSLQLTRRIHTVTSGSTTENNRPQSFRIGLSLTPSETPVSWASHSLFEASFCDILVFFLLLLFLSPFLAISPSPDGLRPRM